MTGPNAAMTAPADVALRAVMALVPAVVKAAAQIAVRHRAIAVVRKVKVATAAVLAVMAPVPRAVTVAISAVMIAGPNAANRPSRCRI